MCLRHLAAAFWRPGCYNTARGSSRNRYTGVADRCVDIREQESMASTVRIPTPLRVHTGGKEQVEATGATVAELLDDLEKQHPGICAKLLDDNGVRRFVNIFVGDEDIRFLDGLATEVASGAEVAIIPAIAGGC